MCDGVILHDQEIQTGSPVEVRFLHDNHTLCGLYIGRYQSKGRPCCIIQRGEHQIEYYPEHDVSITVLSEPVYLPAVS